MKRFRAFSLDPTNHCLWRGNERVSLTPKAFDLLRYLVDHADRLVTQEEILEALWADTFVNQEVVKKYILGIRKVLGDRRDKPEFIRTFPKRGYQFVAPIVDDRPTPTTAARGGTTKAFVDRRAARASLEGLLERSTRGERQIAFVTGDAGIGKTTFVDQFVQSAGRLPNMWIARGQCVEGFGGQEAYSPMLTAFEQLVQSSEDPHFVQLLAKHAPTWLLQFPSLVKADQREMLHRDTLGATRERMVREICETLDVITADRTLILVLEDLHWADLSTLDVVSSCARRQGPSRLLLIGTLRPVAGAASSALSRLHQDLAIHDLAREISLEPFHPTEVSEYLSLALGRVGFADDLAGLIHRHSAGNPLFVTALVRDLLASGIVARDGTSWKLTVPVEGIQPAVPATLQDMLNVQFDQLSDQEQRVLRRASAIGERFPASAVADGDAEIDSVERICEALSARRLFIRGAGMGELTEGTMAGFYQFHHALYRQAVYRGLSDVARSKVHRSIGERLATLSGPSTMAMAAELALHFEKAHDYERAIEYLMLAARNAERRFALRDSVDVLQHALALVPRLPMDRRTPLEIQLLEAIGDAHYVLGAMVESALAYETESALAARSGLIAAQVTAQSCFARPLGLLDPDRAIAVLQDAAKASVRLDDPVMQARIELLAAGTRILYDRWRAEDARVCETSYRIVRDTRDGTPADFDRMIHAHVQLLQGDCVAALENAAGGIPPHQDPVDVMVQLFALSAQILALVQLGRLGEALQIIRSNQQTAERNGSDPWLFSYREAWLRTVALDFQGAARVCDELTHSSVYPTGQAQTIGRVAAGFDALDHGRWDEARRQFEDVRDPNRTPKFFIHWYWRMHAHIGVVRAWLGAGHFANARVEADRLREAALGIGDPNLQALAWEARARVAMAESHWTEAGECMDRAFAVLARFDAPIAAWRIHATASELYRQVGQAEEAVHQRERARAQITALAESFALEEPLRFAMLGATSVRRLCQDVLEMEQ
jgi:DNA-binding winged helix-turn-helix (wHTH) protein/tetratricopeptide (TPR) repeat protein